MNYVFVFAVIFLFFGSVFTAIISYSVQYDPNTNLYNFTTGDNDLQIAAYGSFSSNAFSNGWDHLWINATALYSDEVSAYAAGLLEGFLTHDRIFMSFLNNKDLAEITWGKGVQDKIIAWLQIQNSWTIAQIGSEPTNPYWIQANLLQLQLQGIYDGYIAGGGDHSFTFGDLLYLNADADADDIATIVAPETTINWNSLDKQTALRTFSRNSHCSALIKIMPQNNDVYSAHTTWDNYSNMNRIYKHINIPQSDETIVTGSSFSSYPGLLQSTDDFYVLSNGLVVIETTSDVYNQTLTNSFVKPQSLLSGQRTLLANRMATDGASWVSIFSNYNSGTYNNEWLIIDYNKFIPGFSPEPGFIWLADQAPDRVASVDVTKQFISQGYWASYNVPYIYSIWVELGYKEMEAKFGEEFSYDKCYRANIFRRNQTNVKTQEDVKDLMRYNDFQHDPLAQGQPEGCICLRDDLAPDGKDSPFGCTDSKITNSALVKTRSAISIAGPTHQQQKPFSWTQYPKWPRYGQPTLWDFSWEVEKPYV